MVANSPNNWRLILAGVLMAGVFLASGLLVRSIVVDDRTYELCERIHSVVDRGTADPKPGQYGYTYWREAPAEEVESRRTAAEAVAHAFDDCDTFR